MVLCMQANSGVESSTALGVVDALSEEFADLLVAASSDGSLTTFISSAASDLGLETSVEVTGTAGKTTMGLKSKSVDYSQAMYNNLMALIIRMKQQALVMDETVRDKHLRCVCCVSLA